VIKLKIDSNPNECAGIDLQVRKTAYFTRERVKDLKLANLHFPNKNRYGATQAVVQHGEAVP
jgi:hypothetical protein